MVAARAGIRCPDPLTDFQITGKVYEPQPVSPTDERIEQVRTPAGTRLHRFAEGLYNPRIIAVAGDGTVYVTQRTPGNLVMIKDLDRDVCRRHAAHRVARQGSPRHRDPRTDDVPRRRAASVRIEAMKGHVLAHGELTGTFARP